MIWKAGITLGVLVAVWTLVMGFSGWYKDPSLNALFFLVILIQIGVLIWGLRKTAQEGRSYWGQVGAGTLISLVGGILIFCSSILFTLVIFPEYFEEIRKAGEAYLRSQGKSEAEIAQQLAEAARSQTSFLQALFGFIGTMVTGVVASLVTAAFCRKK
jgi:hypothetical protein